MTQPGAPIYPAPSWWVRSGRVGVNMNLGYGWSTTASGVMTPQGSSSGGYGWSAAATGAMPLPSYSATGPATAGSNTSFSYTDTIPVGTGISVVWVSTTASISPTSIAVTIGGQACTLPSGGSIHASDLVGSPVWLYGFYRLNPLTGSQTVSLTIAPSSAVVANTVHYNHIASIGTPITSAQQSGQPSMAVSSSDKTIMYANAFTYAGTATGNTFTAYSQNQRYIKALAGSTNEPIVIGDSIGNGGTLTFSATRSNTTNNWGGIILPLIP